MSCCSAEALERQFGPRVAAADLRRYRRRGPGVTTRLLIRGVQANLPAGATLLDIGGGIGAIHHELLDQGVTRAWEVDPSAAFLRAAEEEARRRDHAGRVEFIHGDIRATAARVPEADVVTLDRVVCCDPDYEQILELSLAKSRHLFGYSYPRDRWSVRAMIALVNLFRRARGLSFRGFLHPPERMDALIRGRGLRRVFAARSPVWQVAVYARPAAG